MNASPGNPRDNGASPVLVAYDGSGYAKAAIRRAARDLRPGRRVLVLTVPELPAAGGMATGSLANHELAWRAAQEGAELARAEGLDAKPIIALGVPIWQGIVDAADNHGAELIVLGSHGRSGLGYVLLGSVATAVAQHTKRAVMITHEDGSNGQVGQAT